MDLTQDLRAHATITIITAARHVIPTGLIPVRHVTQTGLIAAPHGAATATDHTTGLAQAPPEAAAQVSVVAVVAAVHQVHQASVAAAPPQAVPPVEAQVAAHHPADAAAKQNAPRGVMVLWSYF